MPYKLHLRLAKRYFGPLITGEIHLVIISSSTGTFRQRASTSENPGNSMVTQLTFLFPTSAPQQLAHVQNHPPLQECRRWYPAGCQLMRYWWSPTFSGRVPGIEKKNMYQNMEPIQSLSCDEAHVTGKLQCYDIPISLHRSGGVRPLHGQWIILQYFHLIIYHFILQKLCNVG